MFKKFIGIALLFNLIVQPVWAVTQFTTVLPTSTSDNATNWPSEVTAQWSIFQTLLQNYRQGYYLTYNSSSVLNIGAGEVSVWSGSASLFLQNASSQTATTANLDTGSSFSASTTYYVYCGTSSTTAATCTVTISLNNSAPSGVTYYKQLGNFTTDSNGNIAQIVDNSVPARLGAWATFSLGSTYQAATDGFMMGYAQIGTSQSIACYTDSSPSPSTIRTESAVGNNGIVIAGTCMNPVRKGDYYKITTSGSSSAAFFIPLGQ